MARWMEQLASYKFTVEHVPGREISQVDFLSRRPDRPCSPHCKQCVRIELQEREILKENTSVNWSRITPDDSVTHSPMIKDQRLDENLMPIITSLLTDKIRPKFQDIVSTRTLWHQFQSLVIKDGLLFENSNIFREIPL